MKQNDRRRTRLVAVLGLVLCARLAASGPVAAQALPPPIANIIDMSGPRVGLTILTPGSVDALRDRDIDIHPVVSQFGWQFERRLYTNGDGLTTLTEWVPLISGLDQGLALPSLNWLAGLRTRSGAEFAVGPNLSALGVGLVLAAGVTVRTGALNVPFNVAVATSRSGPRISIMTGFNVRRR
jgi:hypothetical protein